MTKEMVKAIRRANGLNADLRVKLTTTNKSALFDWIDANAYGLFGAGLDRPAWNSPDWARYERMIWGAVGEVISGKASC